MKKILIFLTCLVLGPTLGCFLSDFWHTGGNTFWVESTENEIYQVTYPCSKDQICWMKTDVIPSDISISDGMPVDYIARNDACDNNNFMYPLFHKFTQCITSAVHAPDATHTISLALTNDSKLWIWDQDFEDPFSIMINTFEILLSVA